MNQPKGRQTPEGKAKIGICVAIVIGVALLVLAYAGFTFGLCDSKASVVTAVLTFDAVLFGAVAAVVALAAYLQASGRPELSVELAIDSTRATQEGISLIRGPKIPGSEIRNFLPSSQTFHIELKNGSRYSARNPGVKVSLFGLDGTSTSGAWFSIYDPSADEGRQFQWDGGSDLLVHGKWRRRLPHLPLSGFRLDPAAEKHEITIEYVADGIEPQTRTIPVNVLQNTVKQGTT